MAFCKYCGKKLEEGEVCNCRQAGAFSGSETAGNDQQAASQHAQIPPIQTDKIIAQSKNIAKQVIDQFLAVFRAPATAGAACVQQGNLAVSCIFLALQAICSGLFAVLCIGKINKLISFGGLLQHDFLFSSLGAFFLTFLYSALLSVLLALLFFGGAKLLKGEISFQKALAFASARSIVSAPVILLGCLIFMASTSFGLLFYAALCPLTAVLFLVPACDGIGGLNRNRKIYLLVGVLAVFTILFMLFASNLWSTYIPAEIKQAIEQLQSFLSPENILSGILGI